MWFRQFLAVLVVPVAAMAHGFVSAGAGGWDGAHSGAMPAIDCALIIVGPGVSGDYSPRSLDSRGPLRDHVLVNFDRPLANHIEGLRYFEKEGPINGWTVEYCDIYEEIGGSNDGGWFHSDTSLTEFREQPGSGAGDCVKLVPLSGGVGFCIHIEWIWPTYHLNRPSLPGSCLCVPTEQPTGGDPTGETWRVLRPVDQSGEWEVTGWEDTDENSLLTEDDRIHLRGEWWDLTQFGLGLAGLEVECGGPSGIAPRTWGHTKSMFSEPRRRSCQQVCKYHQAAVLP